MRKLFVRLCVVLFVAVSWFSTAEACDLCCALCGRAEAQDKVCRLVSNEKKLTVTCWTCEYDDICLPGPSRRVCRHCDPGCEDVSDPCSHYHGYFGKMFVWSEWTPCGCGRIKTKKRLMKKTVTKVVPTYNWVVEDLCPECQASCEPIQVPQGVMIPPAPAIENAKIIGGHSVPSPK